VEVNYLIRSQKYEVALIPAWRGGGTTPTILHEWVATFLPSDEAKAHFMAEMFNRIKEETGLMPHWIGRPLMTIKEAQPEIFLHEMKDGSLFILANAPMRDELRGFISYDEDGDKCLLQSEMEILSERIDNDEYEWKYTDNEFLALHEFSIGLTSCDVIIKGWRDLDDRGDTYMADRIWGHGNYAIFSILEELINVGFYMLPLVLDNTVQPWMTVGAKANVAFEGHMREVTILAISAYRPAEEQDDRLINEHPPVQIRFDHPETDDQWVWMYQLEKPE